MKEQRMNRILERIVEKRKQHRKRKKGKEKSDREELRRRDRDNVQIVLWGKDQEHITWDVWVFVKSQNVAKSI